MAATLGLGGSVFDLLDQATAEDPIVTGVKGLASQIFENPGPNDYASFAFRDETIISGDLSPGSSSIEFARLTQLSASFTFGSSQSISLGSDAFGSTEDSEDLVTFGSGSGTSTTLNINLVKLLDFTYETTYEDDSIDVGSMSAINPEDDTDFNLLA